MSLLEYNIMKARHGRYADTAENRRLHRVGQEYGHAAKEDPEAAKTGGKAEEPGKEKRTYDTARKELSTVLSNKEEFIKKYGQDEFDKRVGALVGEARELRDTEHKAEADKDFEAAKNPPKPKDTRSKKEIRTERLEKYKEQLKKIQDKMNQEGESEESKKMGEALEAKWKAKIEKLEAKVNRGKKKEASAEPKEKKLPEIEVPERPSFKDHKQKGWMKSMQEYNVISLYQDYKAAVEAGDEKKIADAKWNLSGELEEMSPEDATETVRKISEVTGVKIGEPYKPEGSKKEPKKEASVEKFGVKYENIEDYHAGSSEAFVMDVLNNLSEAGVEPDELVVPKDKRVSPESADTWTFEQAQSLLRDLGPDFADAEAKAEAREVIIATIKAKTFMNNEKTPKADKGEKFNFDTDKDVKAVLGVHDSYDPERTDSALDSLRSRFDSFSEKDLLKLENEIGKRGAYMVSGSVWDHGYKNSVGSSMISFANDVRKEIRRRRQEKKKKSEQASSVKD